MPQQQPLVLKDESNADVTYSPVGVMSEAGEVVARYVDRLRSALTAGAAKVAIYFKMSNAGGVKYRQTLNLPVTSSVNGVDTIVRTNTASVNFTFAPNSTAAERLELMNHVIASVQSGSQLHTAVTAGEGVWS